MDQSAADFQLSEEAIAKKLHNQRISERSVYKVIVVISHTWKNSIIALTLEYSLG